MTTLLVSPRERGFRHAMATSRLAFGINLSPALIVPRGIYRISRTLEVPAQVSLVGPALHLSSIVPTSTGFDTAAGQPVLRVLPGAKVISQLSITTWTHHANVSAL